MVTLCQTLFADGYESIAQEGKIDTLRSQFTIHGTSSKTAPLLDRQYASMISRRKSRSSHIMNMTTDATKQRPDNDSDKARRAKVELSKGFSRGSGDLSGKVCDRLLPGISSEHGCYKEIGRGSFGTVFECCGTTEVIKVVQCIGETISHDHVEHDNMWEATQRALGILGCVRGSHNVPLSLARVPMMYQLVNVGYSLCKTFFEEAVFLGSRPQGPASFYRAERILPLPRQTTQAMMHAFLP
jgi:hypothetical protein